MGPVAIVSIFECFNMNTQKMEKILHRFFSAACLNLEMDFGNGTKHTPREWFLVPRDVIEQAIDFTISGEIVNYKYDSTKKEIVGA